MTLTLDEVRKTKFHMARRTGYEVSEVDLFVDRVEASFAQLTEENQMLKQQVDTLKQAQGRQPGAGNGDGETRSKTERAPAPKAAQSRRQPEVPAIDGVQKLIVSTSAEASPAVVRLVQLATEQSEQLVSEASDEARRKVDEANQRAEQITGEARSKADKLESDSRSSAERMTNEAQARSADLDRQTEEERTRRFAGLERERDQLQEAVGKLRTFEASYRRNFAGHLKEQLEAVQSVSVEPSDKPTLVDGPRDDHSSRRSQSAPSRENAGTPRLDALAGDHSRG